MPIDDLTILGNMLRAARKEKNFTQQQLADESHISIKEIADIEMTQLGKIVPSKVRLTMALSICGPPHFQSYKEAMNNE